MQKIIAIADLLGFPAQMAEQEAERAITVADFVDTGIHEIGAWLRNRMIWRMGKNVPTVDKAGERTTVISFAAPQYTS